jgi:hypothetical protein
MSIVAHIPQIALDASSAKTVTAACPAWVDISHEDLARWDELLFSSDAWLYQYSFWNEPLRAVGLTPRYLVWGPPSQPLAYVCILTLGFNPARIGLVFRGPTSLQPGAEVPPAAIMDLTNWASSQGYVFIRFTHTNADVMHQIASRASSRAIDAFPYFQDFPMVSPDFVVAQSDDEEKTLDGFDREVRRKLRRAVKLGYEFRSEDSPEALAKQWFLYRDCARRKGFRLERPLSVYMEIMCRARLHDCARVYSVHLRGEAVGSVFAVRDKSSAHCLLAAFAPGHRHAAVFLHWKAMRDMYRLGAPNYNFGPGPGSLARFKQQFAPRGAACPAPVTMVLNEPLFKFWWKALYPLARLMRPSLVGAFSRACLMNSSAELRIQAKRIKNNVRSCFTSRATA